MGSELDIYKTSIDDAISDNFEERDHNMLNSVFQGVYPKRIEEAFKENKNSKILAYRFNKEQPELIYTSKCNSFSDLSGEVNNLVEIVERKPIENYVFLIEKKYKTITTKLNDEQKKQREEFIINDNKLFKNLRTEFWRCLKEKKNQQ